MDWVGSGLVTLAGLWTVGVVLGWFQRLRLARTGGPVAAMLRELELRELEEPPPGVVESLLAEGRIDPDEAFVVGRPGQHTEEAMLKAMLENVDQALWVQVWLMVGVWPLAVVCLTVGWFSWMWALVLVVPMFMVGSVIGFIVSRAAAGLRHQQR